MKPIRIPYYVAFPAYIVCGFGIMWSLDHQLPALAALFGTVDVAVLALRYRGFAAGYFK